jgi:hypothetical protein
MTIMNLAMPKAGAKHQLLFNEPASEDPFTQLRPVY